MSNVPVKYEYITNAHMNDTVTYSRRAASLKEIIMAIKKDRENLFITAEEGSRKLQNLVLLLMKSNKRNKARNWMR